MTLTNRQTQIEAQRAALAEQINAVLRQADPLKAQLAVLDAQAALLADLLADSDVYVVPYAPAQAAG